MADDLYMIPAYHVREEGFVDVRIDFNAMSC